MHTRPSKLIKNQDKSIFSYEKYQRSKYAHLAAHNTVNWRIRTKATLAIVLRFRTGFFRVGPLSRLSVVRDVLVWNQRIEATVKPKGVSVHALLKIRFVEFTHVYHKFTDKCHPFCAIQHRNWQQNYKINNKWKHQKMSACEQTNTP